MQAELAEQRLVAVIAASHDVKQAIRTARVGIVVHGDDATLAVDRETERIPEAGATSLEPAAVGRMRTMSPPSHWPGLLAVRPDPGVLPPTWSPAADIHPSVWRERDALHLAVRVGALS